MSLTVWLLAFSSMFALDVCWAIYTDHAAKGRALGAASWAVLLHLLASATTLAIVDDPRYLTATVVGAFAGTFTGVWWTSRKKVRREHVELGRPADHSAESNVLTP